MLKRFDEHRNDMEPYGLTCEVWESHLMRKPDRHNEIEINFLLQGSLTYLIHNRKIKISEQKIVIFWALMPHQIVDFDKRSPYYVLTIPLNLVSDWTLPNVFLDKILRGDIVIIDIENVEFMEQLLRQWHKDLSLKKKNHDEPCILEIQAMLKRFSMQQKDATDLAEPQVLSVVEKMAVYIAANFRKGIKVKDVSDCVDLHPDYANLIFKKMFDTTISRYLTDQRILYAQRQLSASKTPITSIAFDSGFNSISRFNAAFLKISGCTPREFRKSVGNL